ncbi:MAG: DNRLRE domain-containing protein [Pirellulales bacterium]|nr:DNRLRE domain-containing protein [Pirellulales bacterium]
MRRSFIAGFSVACLALVVQASRGAVVSLAPLEAASKDVLVYEAFGTSNFDNFLFGPLNFGTLLAVANPGPSSVHHVKSLIDFDLSSSGATKGTDVLSAKLLLNVIDAKVVGFPVGNPTPAFPVPVAASLITSSWGETLVTYNSLPSVGALVASGSVTGANQLLTLDVTSAVQGWLNSPASQFGLLIEQTAEVRDGNNTALGAVFASSAFGSLQPALQLTLVPEPASYVMATCGLVGAVALGIRRRSKRRRLAG